MTGSTDPAFSIPHGAARFPASQIQERLWSERQAAREAHNIAFRWRLNGSIKPGTVQTALQVLAERHEALRTYVAEIDGKIEQIVAPRVTIELSLFDLGLLTDQELQERAEDIGRQEARQPFDLAGAPLVRASLIRLGKDRAILHVTFHALIADGWSTGILIREFGTIAAAVEAGVDHGLSEPELHYGDYALWQRAMLEEKALSAEHAYWTRQTADIPAFKVSPDPAASKDTPPTDSEIRSILLPAALSDAIDKFCRLHGHTRFSIAAAGLAIALNRVTGNSEIVLSTQVAGRDDTMSEGVVGPLLNTLPLRFPVDLSDTALRHVERTSETIRGALEHQRLPFEQIPAAATSISNGSPLCSVNLIVQSAYIDSGRADDSRYGGIEILSMPSHSSGALWDLSFFMVGRAEGWRISCESNTDLFARETVDHLLAAWQAAIEASVNQHDTAMSLVSRIVEIAPRKHLAPLPVAVPMQIRSSTRRERNLDRRIVRLQPLGDGVPVISFNRTSVLYPLAQAIGTGRPFIDIQPYDTASERDLPQRYFGDIAADAVRLVRAAQPHGPYILSGFCIYGALAFEVARQLQADGDEVQLVAVFDSWAIGYREGMSPLDRSLREAQIRLAREAANIKRLRAESSGIGQFLQSAVQKRIAMRSARAQEPTAAQEGNWYDDYMRSCARTYRPRPAQLDVAVFRSAEPLTGRLFDRAMGWTPLVEGRLQVFDVAGDHATMFRLEGAKDIASGIGAMLSARGRDQ